MHDACDMCGEETPELLDMEEMGVLCPACAEEAELQAMEDERDARADYAADMKMDARRMGESVNDFDKFMDKILIEEGHNRVKPTVVEDSPMRKRAARHQERPLGRIRFGVK